MTKHLSFIILLAFMLSIFSISFADTTVTIGTGTTSTYEPFNAWYGYGRSLGLYTSAEIGLPGEVTTVGWSVATAGGASIPYKIYAKLTDDTALTAMTWAAFTSTATVVKQGSYTFNSTGWHNFLLDIPFAYTGGNLLIGVEANYGGSGAGSGNYPNFHYTTSATGSHQYWRADTNPPATNGTMNTYRPNLRLMLSPLSDEPMFILNPPEWDFNRIKINTTASKTFSIVNAGGGTLNVTSLSPMSDGFFEVTDASTFPVSLAFGESASFTIKYSPTAEGSHTATFYIVHGGVSYEVALSGTALSEHALFESFEATSFPPPGWANPGTWSRSTTYAKNGTASAYKYGSTSAQYVLSMPMLTIDGNSMFSFWAYCASATGILQLVYSEDRTNWTQLGADITFPAASTWYQHNIDLSSIPGNYYLGLRTGLVSASYYTDMYIGPNITPLVPGAPVLSAPAANATNVSNFPTFTWTAPTTGGVPTSYNIYCDENNPPTTLIGSSTALSFTPTTALPYESTLNWSVTAVNSTGESEQSAARSFTTMADPTIYDLPWSEDFTSTTFPPANWARYSGLYPTENLATTTAGWTRANFANIATPANGSARLNIYGTVAKYWLVTPPIVIPTGAHQLEFDLALTTFSGSNPVDPTSQLDDRFIVFVADNPAMIGATILRQWDNAGSSYVYNDITTLGESHILDLSAHAGTKYIAFYGESTVTGGDNNVYVDNVQVRETPANPIFTYTPDEIDFGSLMYNTPSNPVNLTVSNTGAGVINLSAADISIIGPNAAEFSFDASNLPASLGTGQSVLVPITVNSTTEGNISATLRMRYDGDDYDVALTANVLPEGTLFIGNGTVNNYLPVNAFYHYSYAQTIMLQSEINTADKRIEKIAYYWNGYQAGPNTSGWTVYMGHTNKTAFANTTDWIPLAQLTPVYVGPPVNIPDYAGWVEVELTNPFVYNNIDNLVIAVDENTPLYESSSAFFFTTATTGVNRSLRCQNDSTNPDPAAPPVGTLTAAYPNIMMQFGDLPTLPIFTYTPDALDFGQLMYNIPSNPQIVMVSNTGAGTINLSAADISFIGLNAADFSIDDSNLPASLGTGQSVFIPITVNSTTEGNISATLRMRYDGDDYDVALTANVLPQGTVFIGTGTTAQRQPFGTLYGYERSAALFTASELVGVGVLELVSWDVLATSATSIPYKIWAKNTSDNTMSASLWDNMVNDMTLLKEGTYVFNTAGWHNFTITNPFLYTGGNLIIAVETNYGGTGGGSGHTFKYTSGITGTHQYWYKNNVLPDANGTMNASRPNMMMHFGEPPSGTPAEPILTYPADEAIGLPKHGFELSWLPDMENGGTPTVYGVFLASDIDYIYDEYYWETPNTYFNPVTEGGVTFSYEDRWHWTVQAINADGDAVADPPRWFMIEDDPSISSLPYTENFDSVSTPNLPRAWTGYKSNASASIYTSSTYSHTPSNSVYMYNYTTTETMRLITPPINVPINSIKICFWLRATSATNYSMKVGTVSSPDGSGLFTLVDTITPTVATTWVQYSVSFANYTGTDEYICFQHGTNATYQSFYLDTVTFEELMPTDLAATKVAGPSLGQAGEELIHNVSVYNNGTATVASYTVNLKRQDNTLLGTAQINEALDPDETRVVPVTWTPPSDGTYQVYGEVVAAGDGNASNNQSPSSSIYVFAATDHLLALGDDETTTSGYYVPINLYYRCSLTEELYFPDEMHLDSGTISEIIYKNTSTNTREDKAVKIYMGHVSVNDLTGGWLPADNYSLVFDGNIDIPAGVNDIIIPLTTPFNYTGGVLATRVFRDMDSGALASTDKFFYTTNPAHSNRSRHIQSDTVTYDPLDPAASGVGTMQSYFPNTTFVVQNPVWQEAAVMNGYVYEADGITPIVNATINLTDERYSTTTNSAGYYEFRFWEDHTVSVSVSKHGYYTQTMSEIVLTMGDEIQQDFLLNVMPRVTVSGVVNTNDFPSGIAGAKIKLNGIENYVAFSAAGGVFEIEDVLGSNVGVPYTVTVTLEGYQGYSGVIAVMGTDLIMSPVSLVEFTWPAANVVATHSSGNALLSWDEAVAPTAFFWDFEDNDGGWVSSGYGDWEWTNNYDVSQHVDIDPSYADTPPETAHSGTGMWGTVIDGGYSNSAAWSYMRKTVDLTGMDNPILSFWHYMDGYNTWDYGLITVNGNLVWGTSANAVFMPWQQLTVSLAAFANNPNVEISFEWYATATVSYAGWYIDDIYIGDPPREDTVASRALESYSIYRFSTADEAIPSNWTLLDDELDELQYLDLGFGSLDAGKYKWAVKAYYSGSFYSDAELSNSLGIVTDIANLEINRLATNVELTWTAQAGADFYRIYTSDDPYGSFTYLGYSSTPNYIVAPSAAKKFFKITAVTDENPGRTRN